MSNTDWEKEAKHWKAQYDHMYNSWLSLRTSLTNACHQLNDNDVRMVLAKKADASKSARIQLKTNLEPNNE